MKTSYRRIGTGVHFIQNQYAAGLDHENGQPMETEAIVGNVVKTANRIGIKSLRLESVYALIKLTELKLGL